MLKKIKVSDDVTIVFSFSECGYQEVLDTFPEAAWIDIVTYYLSEQETDLFERIRGAVDALEIRLITNLPHHWDEYWGDGPKVKFRKQLEIYCSMLAPDVLSKEVESFFNVSNHSKIVMTDKLAYIGSMNFSSKSEVNYECGVLLSSPEVIADIRRDIVDYLVENSAPRDLSDIGRAKLSIQSLNQRLKDLMLSLAEGFLQELEGSGKSTTVIRWSDAEISEKELERFITLLDEWKSLVDEYEEHPQLQVVTQMVDRKLLDKMLSIVEDEDRALRRLAQFDYEESVNRHWQEYSGRAYDNLVDSFMEAANADASNEQSDIIKDAVSELRQLRDLVIEAYKQNKAILEKLQEFEKTKWGVDNT